MLICGEGNGTPLQYFAWKIPWMEELGRLQSMGSLRVGHDWATSLSLFIFMHWRRKWQPIPVFLPGESQGRGSLVAAVCGITQSRTRLKWLSSSSSNVNMNFSREKIHSFHHTLKEFYSPEKNKRLKTIGLRNSLAVQSLGLCMFIAEGQGQSLVGD